MHWWIVPHNRSSVDSYSVDSYATLGYMVLLFLGFSRAVLHNYIPSGMNHCKQGVLHNWCPDRYFSAIFKYVTRSECCAGCGHLLRGGYKFSKILLSGGVSFWLWSCGATAHPLATNRNCWCILDIFALARNIGSFRRVHYATSRSALSENGLFCRFKLNWITWVAYFISVYFFYRH